MLRKYQNRCHVNRPGCGRKALFTAVVKTDSGEKEYRLCEHCTELLMAEDKVLDLKEDDNA